MSARALTDTEGHDIDRSIRTGAGAGPGADDSRSTSPVAADASGAHVIVMGVSGSGKTEIARRLAAALGVAFIEGDEFHAAASIDKMHHGIALTDDDRWDWLDRVAQACRAKDPDRVDAPKGSGSGSGSGAGSGSGSSSGSGSGSGSGAGSSHEHGVSRRGYVASCSALKGVYRDRLRSALPGVRFVFLDVPEDVLKQRMAQRPAHFMATSLLKSQLQTLERPTGEPGVVTVKADQPIERVVEAALRALEGT